MTKEELILKWQKEMDETHEWIIKETNPHKCIVFISRETTISDILEDIKNLSGETVKGANECDCSQCTEFYKEQTIKIKYDL